MTRAKLRRGIRNRREAREGTCCASPLTVSVTVATSRAVIGTLVDAADLNGVN